MSLKKMEINQNGKQNVLNCLTMITETHAKQQNERKRPNKKNI